MIFLTVSWSVLFLQLPACALSCFRFSRPPRQMVERSFMEMKEVNYLRPGTIERNRSMGIHHCIDKRLRRRGPHNLALYHRNSVLVLEKRPNRRASRHKFREVSIFAGIRKPLSNRLYVTPIVTELARRTPDSQISTPRVRRPRISRCLIVPQMMVRKSRVPKLLRLRLPDATLVPS